MAERVSTSLLGARVGLQPVTRQMLVAADRMSLVHLVVISGAEVPGLMRFLPTA